VYGVDQLSPPSGGPPPIEKHLRLVGQEDKKKENENEKEEE
jgi:hypothetical protein